MGLRVTVSLACLATSVMATPLPVLAKDADETIVLEPKGPWNLDFGENRCRLARLFGDGESETVFFADQWDPSSYAAWTVAGPAFEKYRKRPTGYAFGPGGAEGEFTLLPSTFGKYGAALMHSSSFVASAEEAAPETADDQESGESPRGLRKLDVDGASEITSLTLSQRGRNTVRLNLGEMAGPLSALNTCTADLVEHWGFDLDEQRTIVSAPKVTNLLYVAGKIQKEYPSAALRAGEQADFHLRLTIDEQGGMESCVWLSQTQAESFDQKRTPCGIFQRYAKITPAKDAAGKPVRTYFTTRVIYRMP